MFSKVGDHRVADHEGVGVDQMTLVVPVPTAANRVSKVALTEAIVHINCCLHRLVLQNWTSYCSWHTRRYRYSKPGLFSRMTIFSKLWMQTTLWRSWSRSNSWSEFLIELNVVLMVDFSTVAMNLDDCIYYTRRLVSGEWGLMEWVSIILSSSSCAINNHGAIPLHLNDASLFTSRIDRWSVPSGVMMVHVCWFMWVIVLVKKSKKNVSYC